MVKTRGVTLVELLIVVTILGMIAAMTAPNLFQAVDRAKQKRTMADMRAIGTACEEYALDHHFYPIQTTQDNASRLSLFLSPIYIKVVPATDSWGWNLQYGTTAGGTGYTVRSYGKDGLRNGGPGPTFDPNCDIVFRNGQFTSFPASMPI